MPSRAVPYLIVDAFTDQPFSGNPAGVVLDAEGLTEREMQAIAREINLSETAFLSRSKHPECRFRLSFFTPSREIKLCGHATVATYAALAERGGLQAGDRFQHETGFGPLPVEVRAGPRVYLGGEPWSYGAPPVSQQEIARLLGLPVGALETKVPPGVVSGRHLMVPLRDLDALDSVKPDLDGIAALSRQQDWVGVAAFTLQSCEPDVLATLRYFVPAYGIPEDPVTGVANAALGGYLGHHGLVPFEKGLARFEVTQGAHVGRPGRLFVEVEGAPGAVSAMRVGGAACVVARGEFLL
ncbi:MAG TPA: PhzF family phenazine biosynthesis protein [Candidatus Thermoplasmatota archaeon]|nr:PhzF family phenazine biosynthesis protein [Candidatus Thermoplasmatota archaeon]